MSPDRVFWNLVTFFCLHYVARLILQKEETYRVKKKNALVFLFFVFCFLFLRHKQNIFKEFDVGLTSYTAIVACLFLSKKKKHIELKKMCWFFLFIARGGFTIHVEIFVTHFFRARSRARSVFLPQLRQGFGYMGWSRRHKKKSSPRFSAASRDLGARRSLR